MNFVRRLNLGLGYLGFVFCLVLASETPVLADWTIHQGVGKLGGYVNGVVQSGVTQMSMGCTQRNAHMGTQINLVELPMPKSALVGDAETMFTVHFDLGAGVYARISLRSHYVDFEKTWVGSVNFIRSQFEALGASKAIIVTRSDGKVVARFSSAGTRKLEQAMRKRCFPNIR